MANLETYFFFVLPAGLHDHVKKCAYGFNTRVLRNGEKEIFSPILYLPIWSRWCIFSTSFLLPFFVHWLT